LYYPADVDRVASILSKEFDVVESSDKGEELDADQFGYRSHHLLVSIKKQWTETPNYKGLEHLPVEIQIRTVLMHAWAEIEHKLQYKNKDQVPRALQRRLFMLSAKFEEADGQFQDLQSAIRDYRSEIATAAAKAGSFDENLELNLDTFKEFLKFFYPSSASHGAMAASTFQEIQERGVSLAQLIDIASRFKPLEKDLQSLVGELPLLAPNVLSYALEILLDGFWNRENCTTKRNEIVERMIAVAREKGVATAIPTPKSRRSAPRRRG
jgi:hypothetical protein